jgi:hypothetical protein
MKYFKKLSTLLIALMVISMVAGAYAVNTANDSSKTINSNYGKILDKTASKNKIIYVANNGNDKNDGLTKAKAKKTIQNAIDTAKSGDTVKVSSGKYRENIKIKKNINLIGNSQKDTIIDGNQKGCCVYIEDGYKISINGFTIQNGKTDDAFMGGGIENRGTLNLVNVKITHNTARQNGAGIRNAGTLYISNSVITGNTAEVYGGGITNDDRLTMEKVTISNNTAPDGAGIYSIDDMYVYSSTISGNVATGHGGGISNYGELDICNSKVTTNKADVGGGISNYGLINLDPETTMGISHITDNIAGEYGGGIYNYATIYGMGDTVIGNNKPDDFKGDPIKPYPSS